jgi:hypothetical protein
LEGVIQLGVDRVICLVFGTNENKLHFIVELYAPGNIIITDNFQNIMGILLSRPDAGLIVGQQYDISKVRRHATMSVDYLYNVIYEKLFVPVSSNLTNEKVENEDGNDQKEDDEKNEKGEKNQKNVAKRKVQKKEKAKNTTIHSILLSSVEYGGDIINNTLDEVGISPNTRLVLPDTGVSLDATKEGISSAPNAKQKEKEKKKKPNTSVAEKDKQTEKEKKNEADVLVVEKDAPFILALTNSFLKVIFFFFFFFF